MIYILPKFENLHPYWKAYFKKNDHMIEENFWGNLALLKSEKHLKDSYLNQLEAMGYCFEQGKEAPAPFYQSIAWIFKKIHALIEQKKLKATEVIWPARVFEFKDKIGKTHYTYRVVGSIPPEQGQEMELVPPHIFVSMLGQGFFPIGGAICAHTNQSLAEHDLAHFGGFIIVPEFMRMVRKGFQKVSEKMQSNSDIQQALQHYDSIYSLRLYYMIEVFTLIPETKKEQLKQLLQMNIEKHLDFHDILESLEKKAQQPAVLYEYLYKIYANFYELVEPLGGESRDILNRVRKFNRKFATIKSKFNGSSLYSMYFNGCNALENKRSTHPDFLDVLRGIHAPFIGALIGTSQLTIEDWVMQAVEECPDPKSNLYQYVCKSSIWNESHAIYWAYGCKNFNKILCNPSSELGK